MFLLGLPTVALVACRFLLVSFIKLLPLMLTVFANWALFDSLRLLAVGQSPFIQSLNLFLSYLCSALLWLLFSLFLHFKSWTVWAIWRALNRPQYRR